MDGNIVCPVCTLDLRPGMVLQDHLELHSKQKVIEALIKLHIATPNSKVELAPIIPYKDEDKDAAKEVAVVEKYPEAVKSADEPQWVAMPNTGIYATSIPDNVAVPSTELQCASREDNNNTTTTTSSSTTTSSVVLPAPPMTPNNAAPIEHSFFYQQITSSTMRQQPAACPQFVVPIIGPQMVPGYLYQHQQMVFTSPPVTSPKSRFAPLTAVRTNVLPRLECVMANADADSKDGIAEIDGAVELHPIAYVVDESQSCKTNSPSSNKVTMISNQRIDAPLPTDATTPSVDEYGMCKFEQTSPQLTMLVEQHAHEAFDHRDENVSIDSAHIRADERMPPRGELSGQESNASASSWAARLQYHESGSRLSTGMSTYDLLARESWDGSDSDSMPPYQSRHPVFDEDVVISGSSQQGIEYKCADCSAVFVCPKERRVHQATVHDAPSPVANTAEDGEDAVLLLTLDDGDCVKDEAKIIAEKTAAVLPKDVGGSLFRNKPKKLTIRPKKSPVAAAAASIQRKKTVAPQSLIVAQSSVATVGTAVAGGAFDHLFHSIMKVEEQPQENLISTPEKVFPPAKIERPTAPAVIICVLCCNVVEDEPTLRDHCIEVHKLPANTKYMCGVCQEGFENENAYVRHLVLHPLECKLCGKHFFRSHNLQLHVKRHLGIKQYKCVTCEKDFLTAQKLREHSYTHSGERPLKCVDCGMYFKRHSNLSQHRNRHHLVRKRKSKDYVCGTCAEVFHSKKKLAWHMETHANKPKVCDFCGEKFVHEASLTRHVRRAHNKRYVPTMERDAENIECPICNVVYLGKSFDIHFKTHGDQPVAKYLCNVCGKEFTTKWNLKTHYLTHAGRTAKPFKCEQCSSAFVREADYTAHMNAHKSIRPYTCNYCGEQFIRKYNCMRHRREHERTKRYKCTVCEKTFHRSYYLNDHMRIHSGLRPFSCHICGKTSTTKSNHNKHVRIHHAREPVSTEN